MQGYHHHFGNQDGPHAVEHPAPQKFNLAAILELNALVVKLQQTQQNLLAPTGE